MSRDQKRNGNIHDKVFIGSAIVFNLIVSAVYISTKFENMALVRTLGFPFVSLILPFGYTLRRFIENNDERRVIISNAVIIIYLILELLLDIILTIPFRDILSLHIVYIVVFYAAEFSMIGVSFNKDRKMGFVVLFTFIILIGCLVYLYLG
jgi:hypothetical protein